MTTHTVAVPGATLTYNVHGNLGRGGVPLVLAGSPMDASGFETLRSHFDDRVVVTYDPRNVGRSTRDDRTAAVTPEEHADDLHAVLVAVGHGPVDLVGSSGGAVNALTMVARHPDAVGLLVAHEPPAGNALPDADQIDAVCQDIVATYDASGIGPAMAKFIEVLMHRGPVGADFSDGPDPDPASYGLPTEDDGDRGDGLMANMRGQGVSRGMPDVEALRAAATRIVVAVGEESGGPDDGEIAGRAAYAVAAALGQEAVVFPGGHAGFLGGEFGQTGKPEAFAARLREVLAAGGAV